MDKEYDLEYVLEVFAEYKRTKSPEDREFLLTFLGRDLPEGVHVKEYVLIQMKNVLTKASSILMVERSVTDELPSVKIKRNFEDINRILIFGTRLSIATEIQDLVTGVRVLKTEIGDLLSSIINIDESLLEYEIQDVIDAGDSQKAVAALVRATAYMDKVINFTKESEGEFSGTFEIMRQIILTAASHQKLTFVETIDYVLKKTEDNKQDLLGLFGKREEEETVEVEEETKSKPKAKKSKPKKPKAKQAKAKKTKQPKAKKKAKKHKPLEQSEMNTDQLKEIGLRRIKGFTRKDGVVVKESYRKIQLTQEKENGKGKG